MKGIKVNIHPLVIVEGILFFSMNQGKLFLFIMVCCFIQEAGQALILRRYGRKMNRIVFSPLGIRIEGNHMEIIEFSKKIKLHFMGTIVGIGSSIILFAFEEQFMAFLCIMLGVLRLIPILPLEGGRLYLEVAGRYWGTLKVASNMTRVGIGCGYGICIFGIGIGILFPIGMLYLPIGLYLIYANKREFYAITRKLYTGLIIKGDKPLKEVIVEGKESPLELCGYLNPEQEIFFSVQGNEGVSQQRVMIALLEKKDREWLWKVAGKKVVNAKKQNLEYHGYQKYRK